MALPVFPLTVAYGSTFKSEFKTRVFEAESGFEQRNSVWDQPLFKADVSTGVQTQEDLSSLLAFFRIVRGKALPFLFRDWSDYYISDQSIGTGDGATVTFDIFKKYSDGVSTDVVRPIKYTTIDEKTQIYLDDTLADPASYTIDTEAGTITFASAPAAGVDIKIGYLEFWIKCRFDTDKIELELEAYKLGNWANIEIREVRE
jgi:uncharacterized protein (TIGR02217 family)